MSLAMTGSLEAFETLRHFVAHLEEGVYVTTADGDLLDANPALLGIFGVGSLDELRRYRLVILPAVECLSRTQIDLIAGYVRSGGTLGLLGPCGVRDEDNRPLPSYRWP